jgi:LemA protein
MTAILAGAGVAVLAAAVIWGYNRLVRARAMVREAWSGIDVQLRRRRELIPNLVEVVRAYGRYERETLERLTALRTEGVPDAAGARGSAETALTRQFRQVLVAVEAYPELQASAQFLGLQRQLAEIEDQIQLARRYYNGTVRELNVLVESVPTNVLAGLAGFRPAEFFEVELATERATPDVRL